jgi:hypothetical protein
MRPLVNGSAIRCAALTLIVAFGLSPSEVLGADSDPPGATAEAPSQWGEDRWVPSFAVIGGANINPQKADLDSFCKRGGPAVDRAADLGIVTNNCEFGVTTIDPTAMFSPARLRSPSDKADTDVSPFVGGVLEVMTPAFDLPGRPRLFMKAEAIAMFSSTRDIANEGSPTGAEVPASQVNGPQNFSAQAITGLGSQTRSNVQTFAWGAGIGVSFPFRMFNREFRIKPSAGWYRYSVDVDGLVIAGLKNDAVPFDPPLNGAFGAHIRSVTLSAEDSQSFDSIGPGLELDMDAVRLGPFGVSLFISAAAYRVLNERSVKLSKTLTIEQESPDPNFSLPTDTYHADWSFKVDPWAYRAAVGIRFHFIGN